MKRPVIIIAVIIASLSAGIVLSPAAPTPPTIRALDRAATQDDFLPEGIPPLPSEEHTIRLLATADGIRYFVGQTKDAASTCLAIYPDDRPTQWVAGCGQPTDSREEIVRTGANGIVTAVLVSDDFDTTQLVEEGFKRVHENIYVIKTTRIPGA
ncbi:hypothetical protein AAIH32_03880 [Pseudarthrobacter oxydans]|uniref:hypothetical protein n=1 Tax=Pseudarthrobacter oxydans TaxID=1671 RepID=UPI003D2C1916